MADNSIKFRELREKYPVFNYNSYNYTEVDNKFIITFSFEIEGLTIFNPTISIDKKWITADLNKKFFDYLVFHIGLVELISYWKCTCSPIVNIKAGYISDEQVSWFKKLYYYGLGEFFFVNNIDTDIDNFMHINHETKQEIICVDYEGKGNLIPIGGGKDSVVSLELLKNSFNFNTPFMINPKEVHLNCAKAGGYLEEDIITINRKIDQNLITLNSEGFLNGHTPFSALVAFVTYFVAYITNKKYIVLSNEASANEATVVGTKINHQYSKTYEFENDFNSYTKKFFGIDIKYFSLLRPLSEYQIGMLFSKYTQYHKIFRSCNVGSKQNPWIWCNNCPKCLFVYIVLSPFLYKEGLKNIFGEDLFEKESLLDTFKELTGNADTKPFECVGTIREVRYSISLVIKKLEENNKELPYLLKYYKDNYSTDFISLKLEEEFNYENNLDDEFLEILKGALNSCIQK